MADEKAAPRHVGVLTSGGDAPGMNAAVRAAVRGCIGLGAAVSGIRRGYQGMIENDLFPMQLSSVGGIINRGGTILGTARSQEFMSKEGRAKAAANLAACGIGGLVVIGGDGSYRGAHALHKEHGIRVLGVPGTIDNDIAGTDYTIGFDTAINTAQEAIDKIRDTAESHDRVFVIEVMGRHAGFIALDSAVAGGAEAVLIPERKGDVESICKKIEAGRKRGKISAIVIVAEGAGSALEIGYLLSKMIGVETRTAVIGHLQRGGRPTALDRVLASKMGFAAAQGLFAGLSDKMVCIENGKIVYRPLSHAWKHKKEADMELLSLVDALSI
ncbi:6-phosphofructokinase [bacterium]|nr:6-phosphofructokinase [bacterium]